MKRPTRNQLLQIISDLSTVLLLGIIFILIFLLIHPFKRGFYCNDESIKYPYKGDTVPLWLAGVYGSLGAILIVLLTEKYKAHRCRLKGNESSCFLNVVQGILFYSMGAMSTMIITEVGKITIGRLRPHFLTVCEPKWNLITCFEEIQGVKVARYVKFDEEIEICGGDAKRIKEARLSFPSGHSSFTVFSMLFIIMYLEARLPDLKRTRFVKAGLQLIAFIAAWHTCMSRVSDHKHHYSDVIAGALLGATVAIFTTRFIGRNLWSLTGVRENQCCDEPEEEQMETNTV